MSSEHGWLKIYRGPMFCAKSDSLLRELRKYDIAGVSTLLIKPILDIRYSANEVVTHDGLSKTALPIGTTYEAFMKIEEELNSVYVIGIDEFQFFENSKELVLKIRKLSMRKRVILASLNLNFRGEPWDITKEIEPYADSIVTLTAICTHKDSKGKICGEDATRTQRLTPEGKPAPYNSPLVVIGGKDIYEARCKRHHIVPPPC